MVDFNSDNVMSSNHEYLLQLMVIESYYNLVIAKQDYYNDLALGKTPRINIFKSRLIGLFSFIKESIRKSTKIDVDKLYKDIKDEIKFDVLESYFCQVETFLYTLGIIRFDNERHFKKTEGLQ